MKNKNQYSAAPSLRFMKYKISDKSWLTRTLVQPGNAPARFPDDATDLTPEFIGRTKVGEPGGKLHVRNELVG